MKLYTDKGNVNALKIILAKELSGKHVEVVVKDNNDKIAENVQVGRLPLLEVESDNYLFSANSAARFIFGTAEEGKLATVIDEWLEWESSQLRPVIEAVSIGIAQQGKTSDSLLKSLQDLLSRLEQTTTNNPEYLIAPKLTVADVVVWSAILPLYCVGTKLQDIAGKFPQTSAWFKNFQQKAVVTASLKSLPGGSAWNDIKACLLSHSPVPLPISSTQKPLSAQPVTTATSSTSKEVDNTVGLPTVTDEEARQAERVWKAGASQIAKPKKLPNPVLPVKGEKNYMITSALPYVNNVPHLGNIIGCVLSADVFSRFCRLRNINTLFLCGTDEYGTATETKAMEEGLTPQEICDKYNKLHSEIYQWFNIGFDFFGRTTNKYQTEVAQEIFWKLHERGYILKDKIEQLLCESCNKFLADRFVEGTCPFCRFEDARGDQCDKCGKLINTVELINPRCKICGKTPIIKVSDHLFMDLPKLQPLLEKYIDVNFERGVFTPNVKVITRSWIRDGLKPRCISRDLKWGTPVPLEGYTDKVFYVWYDAPIAYISIAASYTDQWRKWWHNPEEVELFNFMAKDNVPFHSVIFPSSLLGTGDPWTIVNNLSATEYLNYEDGKFSKSRGIGVFGHDAKGTGIPADVWRFYLLFLRPESQDSSFSWDDFLLKNNSELLNNLGNFINRALSFITNNFGGVIAEMNLLPEDTQLLALITKELCSFIENLTNIKLRDGLRNILSVSRYGNQYIQAHKPWVKVKGTAEDKARAGTILGVAANVVCLLSVMLHPYMPETSKTIQTQLNAPEACNVLQEAFVPYLEPGHKIGKAFPLFQKIEASFINELKEKFAGQKSKESSPAESVQKTESPKDTAALTQAVAAQGDVVRKLKAEKADKAKIDEEVKKLLKLKQDLAASQGVSNNIAPAGKSAANTKANATPSAEVDPATVDRLTKEVSDQGEKVRQLKSKKTEKSVLDPEIAKLLDLKAQLASAKGVPAETPNQGKSGGGKKKKGKRS